MFTMPTEYTVSIINITTEQEVFYLVYMGKGFVELSVEEAPLAVMPEWLLEAVLAISEEPSNLVTTCKTQSYQVGFSELN